MPPPAITRREALRLIVAASALAALPDFAFGADIPTIGLDPDLLKKEIPWPLVLSDAEKRTITALVDLIIPADELGPAASAVGVVEFLDEWVSAPYKAQQIEAKIIRGGLRWVEETAKQDFQKSFVECTIKERSAVLNQALQPGAPKEYYMFFVVLRARTALGYYTTKEGWKAIGYVGNVPLAQFDGPPKELLIKLGVV